MQLFSYPMVTQVALMNDTFNWISTNTVVLRLDGDKIYIWLLLPAKAGQKVQFVKRTIDSAQDVEAFWKAMGGTRSLAMLSSNDDKEISDLSSSLCLIHRLVFGEISDFLQGEELVIVPDGPLYFVPILIGRWTGIKPLIGKEATKAVVLQHLSPVALIHIAA